MLPTVAGLAAALAAETTTSVRLVLAALDRIADPEGEGSRTFLRVDGQAALAQAAASDKLRGFGIVPSPLAGLPVSVKDLFDVAGQPTPAGSRVLGNAPPAVADAPVVARLRAAGAIIVGRTNMTEFAFSGLGLNPHFGTPGNPADRGRIPGGSSSGAAVSVADRMAVAALGSDTGGSVRIPAAFCGLVGFKPTQARVPLAGGVPLSSTLDCYGPLAATVACCAELDQVLAGEAPTPLHVVPLAGLRLGVPRQYVLDGLDEVVAGAFARALDRLAAAGARVGDLDLPALSRLPAVNAAGGFAAAESYAWHRRLIETSAADYDPRVLARILRGQAMSAADYVDLQRWRGEICAEVAAAIAGYDAVLMPTVAIVPPRFEDLAADDDYMRINGLVLRNCSVVNFLDRCAATVPCHAPGELPVGLMLMGERLGDRRLLAVAQAVETVLAGRG